MVERVRQEFGRIDVLVNNATLLGESEKAFEDYVLLGPDVSDGRRGPALLTQAIWASHGETGRGKIVCIGSIAGRMGGLGAGPHYTTSKGPSCVREVGRQGGAFRDIREQENRPWSNRYANDRRPRIHRRGIPLGRLGQPEDIAMAVVFLASQASNFITGRLGRQRRHPHGLTERAARARHARGERSRERLGGQGWNFGDDRMDIRSL